MPKCRFGACRERRLPSGTATKPNSSAGKARRAPLCPRRAIAAPPSRCSPPRNRHPSREQREIPSPPPRRRAGGRPWHAPNGSLPACRPAVRRRRATRRPPLPAKAAAPVRQACARAPCAPPPPLPGTGGCGIRSRQDRRARHRLDRSGAETATPATDPDRRRGRAAVRGPVRRWRAPGAAGRIAATIRYRCDCATAARAMAVDGWPDTAPPTCRGFAPSHDSFGLSLATMELMKRSLAEHGRRARRPATPWLAPACRD